MHSKVYLIFVRRDAAFREKPAAPRTIADAVGRRFWMSSGEAWAMVSELGFSPTAVEVLPFEIEETL